MEIEELSVTKLGVIRVCDRSPGGGLWTLPGTPHIGMIVPWRILHQIVVDWDDYAATHAIPVETEPELHIMLDGLVEQEPRYIQCLFSYIIFFFLLESGFRALLAELRKITRDLGLSPVRSKQPPRSEYIDRLWRVRTHSIVHWGGPDKKDVLNSHAGRFWGYTWPGGARSLHDLEFGAVTLEGAAPRNLQSLPATHALCSHYLRQMDTVCTHLLLNIVAQMPLTVGQREYSYFPFWTQG